MRIIADAIRDNLYGRDESQITLIKVYTEHNKCCPVVDCHAIHNMARSNQTNYLVRDEYLCFLLPI